MIEVPYWLRALWSTEYQSQSRKTEEGVVSQSLEREKEGGGQRRSAH